MKKIAVLMAGVIFASGLGFAQAADDDFYVSMDEDFSAAQASAPAAEAPKAEAANTAAAASSGNSSNIKMGMWIEARGESNFLIRDKKNGTKDGYELDNAHFASKANWWFWGNITPNLTLDAEIGVWNFDKTLYQANSYAANVPTTTWGDGFQSLAAMLWSPLKEGNTSTIGAFNKMGFTIQTPVINTKIGYGDLKKNGMLDWTGIYHVIDRWNNVGNGFTEISLGKKLSEIGSFKINAVAAFSEMRGTYGMYDLVDVKYDDLIEGAFTFGSSTTSTELFLYNRAFNNAMSGYVAVTPVDWLKLEAHGILSYGSKVDLDKDSMAIAGRVSYLGADDWLKVSLKESYAGKNVNSVWGADGQKYDDINKDTSTTVLLASWKALPALQIGADETLTFNGASSLGDGLMTLRNQPMVDFDFGSFLPVDFSVGVYGVINLDRLALSTSADRNLIAYVKEAGIEVKFEDLPFAKRIVADYAIEAEYKDWTSGNSYDYSIIYNSIMLNADLTDKFNVHAGSVIRQNNGTDDTVVPAAFAAGFSYDKLPLPGKPRLWVHFTYSMNPYEDNNYTLYRADHEYNKPAHRTYLLNCYDTSKSKSAYTISSIALGLIWNL